MPPASLTRAAGVADSSSSAAQKRKRAELAVELEKVKHAREQREAEKEAWEEERRLLDREREQMDFHEARFRPGLTAFHALTRFHCARTAA